MERGGRLAVAVRRGRGELDHGWHEIGRAEREQTVFADVCANPHWPTSSGWTLAERLGISGAPAGAPPRGARRSQHSGRLGAAVAELGLVDPLCVDRFIIAWARSSDVGDPDDPWTCRPSRLLAHTPRSWE